jgi:hypothetical protein
MWLNQAYMSLTGLKREEFGPGDWQKAIYSEDLARVEGNFGELAQGRISNHLEE